VDKDKSIKQHNLLVLTDQQEMHEWRNYQSEICFNHALMKAPIAALLEAAENFQNPPDGRAHMLDIDI